MSSFKPKRLPAWKILINALMEGVRIEVRGVSYQYFRKGEIVDTVPASNDQYEINQNGFFMLCAVTKGNVEMPSKWMFAADTISFVFEIAEHATDADLGIATANAVINKSKRLLYV